MTTLSEIANKIDQENWGFSVAMTSPKFQSLVKNAYQVDDTLGYLTDLIKNSGATEIQISPLRKNGSVFKGGIAKTITLNLNTPNMNNQQHSQQHGQQQNQAQNFGLNGGAMGLGFSEMVDYRHLKSEDVRKADTISDLKTKVATLEKEKALLEIEKRALETEKATADKNKDLELKLAAIDGKSSLDKLLENPTLITTIMGVLKPAVATQALGAPAQQTANQTAEQTALHPKVKFVSNFLNNEKVPENTKDLFAILVKSQMHEKAQEITSEIVEVLKKHELIK